MSESPRDLAEKRPVLEIRNRVFSSVRSFFGAAGYLEVQTPVRIPVPAMEEHINAEASGDHWLRTSPELHMKRMLCAGYEKIVLWTHESHRAACRLYEKHGFERGRSVVVQSFGVEMTEVDYVKELT